MAKPRRYRPDFHFELLVCGLRGHELLGSDAAELRPEDALIAREMEGQRWLRCVRCDSWLPVAAPARPAREHPPDRDVIELPLRGRPLRDKLVLRAIAIDRAFHFVVLSLLAAGVFIIAENETDLRDLFFAILGAVHGVLGGPTTSSDGGFVHEIDDLLSWPKDRLYLTGLALAAYALLELVEAVGLWRQQRWAEYLTLVATAVFIPLEVYELANGVTPFKVFAFVLNVVVIAYLLFAKRLFGLRGGAAAEEALRARDVGWASLEGTAPEAFAVASPGGPAHSRAAGPARRP